ncbi:MAG: helix-turn-helix transcriptional regulator [Bdellovibrionota bacterium]
MQKFGTLLKDLRKRAGLTQEELARALNVSNTYIHQLETTKIDAPTEDRCEQLARILGVEPGELWELARRERLLRYARREGIEDAFDLSEVAAEGLSPGLSKTEVALIKLVRRMDAQTLKHFNDTVYMLLRYVPREDVQEMLKEYLETYKVA